MCIFTHFAAGALAGGLTGNLYYGAVAGFASHALLDVIPHYDHPDWRLELGGGVVSLLLLLLMPFASGPAIVGGIFGMVPDIENLLQKLGKMSRDQFVYPTHTGLLPHGRTLGPKSIVWQFAIFAGCFLFLGLFNPSVAQAASSNDLVEMANPVVRVLETNAERTVVRVDFPVVTAPTNWQAVDYAQIQWALTPYYDQTDDSPDAIPTILPPRLPLSLAVPTRRSVTWVTRDIQWWKEPAGGRLNGDLVRFSQPVVARSVPLTGTEVPLGVQGGVLRGVTIEISHNATGSQREHLNLATEVMKRATDLGAGWDNWRVNIPSSVLNPALFESLATGSRQAALQLAENKTDKAADLFAMTSHWVKLNLTETGLYELTGQELSNYGVSTTAVDPTKLRLYRGGGLPLAADPETPDVDQDDRIGLNELAIEVVDGNDGEWNLDDVVRFYGVGTSTWLDRLGAAGERLEHYDHPYAAAAVYWLTWEDDLTISPLPGLPKRAAVTAATPTGSQVETTARVRLHMEKQNLDTAGLVQDNWVWDNTIFSSRSELFNLRTPVTGSVARYQIDIRGVYTRGDGFLFEVAGHLNDDQENEASLTIGYLAQNDSLRVRLVGESLDVRPGSNLITIDNNSTDTPLRPVALDSYDILYWTDLKLTSGFGQLAFAHWGDQVAAPGTGVDLVVDSVGELPLLWDVSDPANAQILSGSQTGDIYTYGVTRDPDSNRHFVATAADELLSVVSGVLSIPISLRSRSTALDYIVVYAPAFSSQAVALADYHSQELPGVANPVAVPVNVESIYENFSGGQKDPLAIRNYLKWVYEQSGHRLGYVCFLGNASRDYRNYRNKIPLVDLYDLVSSQLRTSFPLNPSSLSAQLAYASDDGLVSFDSAPALDLDFPDLACGRLPAMTMDEARGMVDRALSYAQSPADGLWRNRVLMTADDVVRPSSYPDPRNGELAHTEKAEDICNDLLPVSLDLVKVYGVDYDFPPGTLVKPQTRADINLQLSQGATIFYYVGHGAEDNLADEQIFQSRDIPNLTNAMKRPVFVAFSCDVGVFDSPTRRSMAEQFLQFDAGGAIGSICASQVSWISYNNALSDAFFSVLYPGRHVDVTRPVSEALRLAKVAMTISPSYRKNSQRYNLFGDPGMRLPNPVDDLSFTTASLDTLRAGARQVAVLSDSGKALLGAGDTYSLRVEESAWHRRFPFSSSLAETSFVKPGSSVFVGSGTMGSGDLRIPFKVPVQLRYGDLARVRLILETPDGDHVATAVIPSVRAATVPSTDVTGPAISLRLPDGVESVEPGAVVSASLTDTSGIAILGTSPGNSLLLEFDDSGFMTDVTSSFTYDAESYTTGSLTFTVPGDLDASLMHKAALHASDALGNVGSDTLSFPITGGNTILAEIRSATLFPNPTVGYCRLLVDLSVPMKVQWDIYTLAGNRLWSTQQDLQADGDIIEWSGLDSNNDEIANGTYLFVVRGLATDSRERELRKTGKLVIMR